MDLFSFFKRFSKDIEEAMPKEETKKRAGAAAAKGGAGAKPAGAPSFQAELMKKLAAAQK